MKENRTRIYIPFGGDEKKAMAKTTHLAIAAHQDDVEIMAQHGILTCFQQRDKAFSAIVLTDGAGSPRSGIYSGYTDEEMKSVRATEQKRAAAAGGYAALVMLNHTSGEVKDPAARSVVDGIKSIVMEMKPSVIYLHNPADKHDTHVAASVRALSALRELAREYRPDAVYGCEVWRGLDWVNDDEKIAFDISERPALKAALLGVYDSQIEGGKRYDLAALGRYCANATFYESHNTDKMTAATYALDLTSLIDGGDISDFIAGHIENFAENVRGRLARLGGTDGGLFR